MALLIVLSLMALGVLLGVLQGKLEDWDDARIKREFDWRREFGWPDQNVQYSEEMIRLLTSKETRKGKYDSDEMA